MEVLLHADIPKLGYFGDVVKVAEGYARNYLLPQRLAVRPTEANIKEIAAERAQQVELRRLARERLVKAAAKVDGLELTIPALANEQGHLFGSVGAEEIAKAICEKGFEVQSKSVKMAEHLRQLGDYDITLRFAEGLEATVKLQLVSPQEQADDTTTSARADRQAESQSEPDDQSQA